MQSVVGEQLVDQDNALASVNILSCDRQLSNAVWYKMSGTGTKLIASTCGSLLDSVIHAFFGECDALSCVASTPVPCLLGVGSSVEFCSPQSTEVFIAVDGFHGRLGSFTLEISDTFIPCEGTEKGIEAYGVGANEDRMISSNRSIVTRELLASNELCQTATNLDAIGFPATPIEIVDSTKDSTVPYDSGCINSESRGLWYRFTGTGTMVRVHTCESTINPYESIIQVVSGSCEKKECVAYTHNEVSPKSCEFGGDSVFCTELGESYWIYVEGKDRQVGQFILNVRDTTLPCDEPQNSVCEGAQQISTDETIAVNHRDVPPSYVTDCELVGTPDGSAVFTSPLWFEFIPQTAGEFVVDICDSLVGSFDIRVYTGDSCEERYCFGTQDEQFNCPSNGNQASRVFCTEPDQSYYIAVYGGYGSYSISVRSNGACSIPCKPVCDVNAVCIPDTCSGVCGICQGECIDQQCVSDTSSATPSPASTTNPSASVSPTTSSSIVSLASSQTPSNSVAIPSRSRAPSLAEETPESNFSISSFDQTSFSANSFTPSSSVDQSSFSFSFSSISSAFSRSSSRFSLNTRSEVSSQSDSSILIAKLSIALVVLLVL